MLGAAWVLENLHLVAEYLLRQVWRDLGAVIPLLLGHCFSEELQTRTARTIQSHLVHCGDRVLLC